MGGRLHIEAGGENPSSVSRYARSTFSLKGRRRRLRFDIDRLDIELTGFDAADAPAIPVIEVRE